MSRDEGTETDLVALAVIVRRVLQARTADQHLVEDLVQETLLRVATTRRQLGPTEMRAYAIVTARNALISDARKRSTARRHAHRVVEFTNLDSPEQASLERAETDALATALRRLDEDDRRLLLDHEVDDKPLASLAAEADVTAGAIGMRLDRARATLRLEFVLAYRHVTLPTSECRRALISLSSGDRRRQRSLATAEHLLSCTTCAQLSEPLVERKRGAAAWILFPFASVRRIGQRLRTSRPAQIATGIVVTMAIALLVHSAWKSSASSATSGTSAFSATSPISASSATSVTSSTSANAASASAPTASAPSATTGVGEVASASSTVSVTPAGAAQSVPGTTPGPSVAPSACAAPAASLSTADAGCPWSGTLTVTEVPANEGFWSRSESGQDIWIHLVGVGESPQHVRDRDSVRISGIVRPMSDTAASGIPTNETTRLTAAGFFVDVQYADLQVADTERG